jgi:methyl acetate hydrolase
VTRVVLVLGAWSLIVGAALASSPARTAFDQFLRRTVAGGDVPAVVAMVVDRRTTRYVGAFGKQNVAENRDVTPGTIFRIASMTKPVTSLAAMMLVGQGRLSVDDPVTKYLPEFEKIRVMTAFHEDGTYESRPPKRMITVRDLLTHTSGIGYSFADARLAKLDSPGATELDLPLLHDPGEKFTYGPNTAVVGRIVEKISGEPLDRFFQSRIFGPLGMHDTFFVVPASKRDRVITLHNRSATGSLTERPNGATLQSPVRGDGGLFSTAADYARFMQLFLNDGCTAGGARLIRPEILRTMTSNQIGALTVVEQPSAAPAVALPFPIGAGKDTFGFGFQIEQPPAARGMRTAGSLSWGGVDNTHFWIDPRRAIAAVVLMQMLPYYDPGALTVLRGFERIVYRSLS